VEDLLNVMYARRSIRNYTDEPVAAEQVDILLKAAMSAPSANNLQPWHFAVVQKRRLLDNLAGVHEYAGMLQKAPLAIVVCGNTDTSKRHWVEDTSAATENLLLAATALGLGAVWIGIHPSKKRQKFVRKVLAIPKRFGVLCVVAIGHPAEQKEPRTQYNPRRVHYERWNSAPDE
jgi:nitroreductase